MSVLYTNNATTTLASGITDSATSITIASGTGALFPTISGSDYFNVTLTDSSKHIEIVKVTARSGDVLTVTRAQEGTSARTWLASDILELRLTKNTLDQLKIDAVNGYAQLDSDATFDSIQFNGGTGTQGTMSWNPDEETVDLIQDGATLQLGQELQTHCRNNTVSSIPNATVVMATGTIGASGRITIAPWDGTTDVKFIVGITTEVIAAGTDGKVTTFGKVRDVDTSLIAGTFTNGVIYASTSVAGGLTYDKPTTKAIPLAFLIANETSGPANNGTIMVRVTPVNEVTLDHAETAYGWGNHASAGYASASTLSSHTSNTSNPHSVTATQVGLGNVTNESKATMFTSPTFTGTVSGITKTMVGLGNVDNTSDVNKPVSTAQAASIATKVTANSAITAGTGTKITYDTKGLVTSSTTLSASDIPSLDASKITSGTIDSARLPSYVDDVIEATNLASFPTTGETGKIYVDLDTNKTYRWSGSAYVYITSGAVDSVAGKTGVVTLVKGDVGLGSVDNTADSAKNVLSATKLTTARTINGVSFDGTANITVADSTKQPVDADLTAIAGLTGTSGLLKKTAADTWTLDTSAYVTSSGVTSVTGTAPIVSSGGTTPAISISAATTSAAGSMSSTDKTKLDGIAAGAQVNVATNIGQGTLTSTTIPLTSSTGTGTTLPSATTTLAGLMSAADKTKLDGVASGATANTGTVTSVVGGSYLTGGTITTSGTLAVDATSANTASKVVARDASGNFSAGTITASLSGNATTVTSITSSQVTTALGFTPYNSTNPSGYITGITSGMVTTALGFTPYNSTNPAGYTSNTGTVTSVSGTGSYGGLTLSGSVTTSGSLTLGGTPTGTWPISISGNAATASNGGVTSVNGLTGAVTLSTGGVTSLNGQTGAIVNTNIDAIGSIVCAWKYSANYATWPNANKIAVGSTIAGSDLRYNPTSPIQNPIYGDSMTVVASFTTSNTPPYPNGSALSGTWRCIARNSQLVVYDPESVTPYSFYNYAGLFVRVS